MCILLYCSVTVRWSDRTMRKCRYRIFSYSDYVRNIEKDLSEAKKRCRELEAEVATAQSHTVNTDVIASAVTGNSTLTTHVQQLNEQIGMSN